MLSAVKKRILDCLFFWTRLLPLQETLVFESNPDFNDETFWLCKKLMEAGYGDRYRIVWVLRDPTRAQIPEGWRIGTVPLSPRSVRELVRQQLVLRRAKVIFESCYFFRKGDRRQRLVDVYHGMQMKDIRTIIRNIGDVDFFANGTHYSDEYFIETIRLPQEKLLHFGMTRNDELIKKTDNLARLGLRDESIQKTVLWMPTYRQHVVGETTMTLPKTAGLGLPYLYDRETLLQLNDRLKAARTKLIVKVHQSQVLDDIRVDKLSHIALLTTGDLQRAGIQLYSVIGEADALITDYSSVYYDFVLLGRPIGLACDDLARYEEKVGFVFSEYEHGGYEENVEGCHIRSFEELAAFCTDYTLRQWQEEHDVEAMKRRYHDVTDFRSGERYLQFCRDILGL